MKRFSVITTLNPERWFTATIFFLDPGPTKSVTPAFTFFGNGVKAEQVGFTTDLLSFP